MEKLHEIKVKNHYNERAAKKKLEEIKAQAAIEVPKDSAPVQIQNQQSPNNLQEGLDFDTQIHLDGNDEHEQIDQLD